MGRRGPRVAIYVRSFVNLHLKLDVSASQLEARHLAISKRRWQDPPSGRTLRVNLHWICCNLFSSRA